MIDWEEVFKFKPANFSENPDTYAEPTLLQVLQAYRMDLGQFIFPSPVAGALARFDGSTGSHHYVGEALNPIRKSTAVDIFVEGIPVANLFRLFLFPLIKGIGLYLHTTGPDGKAWPMFHIDLRQQGFGTGPLFWICEKIWSSAKKDHVNTYRYPQSEPQYWNLLQNEKLYFDKRFGK